MDEPDPKMLARSAGAPDMEAMAAPMAEPVMMDAAVASYDGLAVTYTYPGTVSIANEADRTRLALGRLEAEADITAFAAPLYDETAFLTATFTNTAQEIILPTAEASYYVDGRFIGKTGIDLIPSGGEETLSFGPIEGLRLTRTVLDKTEGDRGVITRSNQQVEQVEIEVENLTGEAWPLRVEDRVPYSEQEDLEITWEAVPPVAEQNVDGKRGVLAWAFDLPAGETKTITLSHTLKWPEDMILR